jgi:hypothetical protein
MNKSIAIGLAFAGAISWYWPGFSGYLFAPSNVGVGEGRIVGSIFLLEQLSCGSSVNPRKTEVSIIELASADPSRPAKGRAPQGEGQLKLVRTRQTKIPSR